MESYVVEESSGAVEVCVISSPELDKSVEIELATVEGSAGKYILSQKLNTQYNYFMYLLQILLILLLLWMFSLFLVGLR